MLCARCGSVEKYSNGGVGGGGGGRGRGRGIRSL